jgi:hypothetical protein
MTPKHREHGRIEAAKPVPVLNSKGDPLMFPLSRIQFLKFAAAGALVVLSSLGTTARADELRVVGPRPGHLTAGGIVSTGKVGEERFARTAGNVPMAPAPVTSPKAEEAVFGAVGGDGGN